jgi:dihydrofolate reductase
MPERGMRSSHKGPSCETPLAPASVSHPSPIPQPLVPELVLIAAVAEENRVIGNNKDLPWHIPEDLQHFKELTTGHALVMGRRTFESIVHQFGGPLPDRRMVVLTRQHTFDEYSGVETHASVDAAMEAVADEEVVFIGGGESIYRQFLPRADRLELTLVEGAYEGDTYFPPFEHLVGDVFAPTQVDERDGFRFVTYERRENEED